MSYSFTKTASSTFTIVHSRQLTSKVAADMHLCALYYGQPSEARIRDYAEEFAQHLNEGYVSLYEFGYKRNGIRVVSWRYTVDENGRITTDDNPGKVVPYIDVTGAHFYNFLWNSPRFYALSEQEQTRFESGLPFSREAGDPPSDGPGRWAPDKNYFASGRGLGRETFQAFT